MSAGRPNPYPGLRPFRTEEDYLFFGREEQTAELLGLLEAHRFLTVVGSSGSGKSSLVRAGLVPALVKGAFGSGAQGWRVAIGRPGGDPIESLAAAICEAGLYDDEDGGALPRVVATLGRSTKGLVEAFRQSRDSKDSRLLVIVDQFEELFRFAQDDEAARDESRAFVALLLEAAGQSELPIYVVVTMRSDYIGDCARIPGLAEAVNAGEYLVPRLGREQIRRAIEGPAKVGGGSVTKRLVQRLLNDVGDDADQLPVLQHALMRTWDAAGGSGELDIAHYESTGGVAAALSRHADEVLEGLASERLRDTAERVFKTLTQRVDGERGVRRPTRVSRLEAICRSERDELEAVLDAYRAPGVSFLMPGPSVQLDEDPVVDISHESLMRVWDRLRGWVEEEARSAATYRRLAESAALWRDGRAGLYRHPELDVAQAWRQGSRPNPSWASLYAPGYENAISFLDASQQAMEQEEREHEAARLRELEVARALAETQARSARLFRRFSIGVAVLAAVALGLAVQALRLRGDSERNRAIAVQNEAAAKSEAHRALEAESLARHEQGRAWLERARSLAAEKRFLAAKLLAARTIGFEGYGRERLGAIESEWGRSLLQPGSPEAAEARGMIDDLPEYAPVLRTGVASAPGVAHTVSWSPDGRRVAIGCEDGSIEILDGASGTSVHRFETHRSGIAFLDWTADGAAVVSASRGRSSCRRHDVATGAQAWVVEHDSAFRAGAMSPDRRAVAVADSQGWLLRIDVESGRVLSTLVSPSASIAVAFHPRAPVLASGHQDGMLRLWSLETGEPIQELLAHEGWVRSVTFDADGGHILTTGEAREPGAEVVRVWETGADDSWALRGDWSGFGAEQSERPGGLVLTWSEVRAQGDLAVVSARDGTLHVRSFPEGVALGTLEGHRELVRRFDISPDGERLVSVSRDGSARIWDLESRREIGAYTSGDVELAQGVDFDPVAGRLASSTEDGQVRIRDLVTGEIVSHRSVGGDLESLRYSPDGARLAVLERQALHVLDAATLDAIVVLPIRIAREVEWSPDGRFLVISTALGAEVRRASDPDTIVTTLPGAQAVALRPDGRVLATSAERTGTSFWDLDSGERLASWPEVGSSDAIAYHPDGRMLALAQGSGVVTLVEAGASPRQLGELGERGGLPPRRLAFSPDGRTLAVADGTVRLWDVRKLRLLAELEGHSRPVLGLSFSPDGLHIASTSEDHTLRVWNVERSLELESIDVAEGSHRRAVWVDEETMAVIGRSGVRVVDRRSGRVLQTLPCAVASSARVAVSPGGRYLAVGDQSRAYLWDLETGEELARFESWSYDPASVAFRLDAGRLVVGRGVWLDVYDLETRATRSWLRPRPITDLCFDAVGQVWTAGHDGVVHVLDPERQAELGELRASGSALRRLLATADGEVIVTADVDGVVRAWNSRERTVRHQLSLSSLRSVVLSPDGRSLAAIELGEVSVWELESGQRVHRLAGAGSRFEFGAESVDFSPSGEWIAVDGLGSTIAIVRAAPVLRPPARLVDFATDLRIVGGEVMARPGGLLTARPTSWRPPAETAELGVGSEALSGDRRGRAFVDRAVATGSLRSAVAAWRRLSVDTRSELAPRLLASLLQRARRIAANGGAEVALSIVDLARELTPQVDGDQPFEIERTRAEILFDADRVDESLALFADAIATALSEGQVTAAQRLGWSRLHRAVETGDPEIFRDQLDALVALPGLGDPARRSRAVRAALRRLAASRIAGSRDERRDLLDALALAEAAIASGEEPEVDVAAIEALRSAVVDSRAAPADAIVLSTDAEWMVWAAKEGAPPADWRQGDLDPEGWVVTDGPILRGQSARAPALRSPALVEFARTSFELDPSVLRDDLGLVLDVSGGPGVVVHLNGVEVARWGLPPGELGPETSALPGTRPAQLVVQDSALSEAIRSGVNVLAIESRDTTRGSTGWSDRLEIQVRVTPASLLRAAASRLDTALAELREWLPADLLAELEPQIRLLFASRVPEPLALEPRPEVWLARGRAQRAVGQVDAAIEAFERCLELGEGAAGARPVDAEARSELDELRRKTGRSER